MARIRSIKPDFFLDHPLAQLDPRIRLFFIGLWCQADKAGRLRDEPEKLQVQIVPWDKISAEECLSALHPRFIVRYEADGVRLIQIKNWRHQKPHHTEADSNIPAPQDKDYTVGTPILDGLEREGKGEGSGKGGGGGSAGKPAEPKAPPVPEELEKVLPTLQRVRLQDAGMLWQVWRQAYPDVDIIREILKTDAWAVGKKVSRSPKGWARTLNTWLSKEQDKKRPAGGVKPLKPGDPGFTPTPLDYVILGFRDALEVPEADRRAWSNTYWEDCRADAQAILDFFEGDWKRAKACVEYIVRDFRGKGLSVTLRTVKTHAHDYKYGRKG